MTVEAEARDSDTPPSLRDPGKCPTEHEDGRSCRFAPAVLLSSRWARRWAAAGSFGHMPTAGWFPPPS